MGIINTTPDSFYAGSRAATPDDILETAGKMLREGALILDIGGQSTRPGAQPLGEEEEARRVLPAIRALAVRFPQAFLSVDTYHAGVAAQAVEAGADMINDISGGSFDPGMLSTAARSHVPYVCMHNRGTVTTMHQKQSNGPITTEILDDFFQLTEKCRQSGIHDVILDPGFGFGKDINQNFELLATLSVLKILNKPILAGISRKSTIYRTLGVTPEEALNGTTVMNTLALLNGASILRVHDVREAVEAITLVEKYNQNSPVSVTRDYPTLRG